MSKKKRGRSPFKPPPRPQRPKSPVVFAFDTKPEARLRLRVPQSIHAKNPPWLEKNIEVGYLARELAVLRAHNMTFKQDEPQDDLLMFAEGALVLVTMERFLRTILAGHVGPDQTLPNLLELAFSERVDALDPPGGDAQHLVALVKDVRNALLHANFEQATKQAGAADVRDYFRNHYAREIETLYKILNNMMSQIDPATGARYETPERRAAARSGFLTILERRRRKLERSRR